MSCPLCVLEKRTEWLYEDDKVVVCICETCGVPMMVLRAHKPWNKVSVAEAEHMEEVRDKHFQGYQWRKQGPRRIKDHYHWHLVKIEGKSI